jgi:flagellar biosynthetic protein FliR
MIQSYDIFPVGLRPEAAGFSQWGIFRISQSFAMAFTLAAPFVVTAVIYNLTLGLINRAMPQLMVFFIGAPAITFGGLVILAIGSPLILVVWSRGLSEFIMNPAVGMP